MIRPLALGLVGALALTVPAEAARSSKVTKALKSKVTELRREIKTIKTISQPRLLLLASVMPMAAPSHGFADTIDRYERPPAFVPPAVIAIPDALGRVIYGVGVGFKCFPENLKAILQDTASRFGDILVNSGHRSPAHNRRVRGASRSEHIPCRAADFSAPQARYSDLAAYLYRHKLVGGLGVYRPKSARRTPFVHIDVRPYRVVWSSYPITEARRLLGVGPQVRIASYGHSKRVRHSRKSKPYHA